MTTASVLLTVSSNWNSSNDKCDKEKLNYIGRDLAATVAARELRETSATREQALRLMREWISQNDDIKNVRQDELFLLRFLRQKKFSIPMAQQTLLKYLNLRKYYPDIRNLDCEDPRLEEILNSGYITVSPNRDNKGRRVILYNMGKFDAMKFTCWDLCRIHFLIYETLMEDPQDQICGVTHVGDGSGTTTAHITFWNPVDLARLMKWGEQSVPMRHKECHLVNIHATIKYAIDFAASKVTPKMAERLSIHSNQKQLHKHVDVNCLPTIYGGKITTQEMISFTKQLVREQRSNLLSLDKMEIISTRGIVSSKSKSNGKTGDVISIQGSFRKLEID